MLRRLQKIGISLIALELIIQLGMPILKQLKSQAVEAETNNKFQYTINDDNTSITITKYVGTDAEVIIPSKINGYFVTEIGYMCFSRNNNVTSVKIPNTIKIIGNYAFEGCSNLKNIEIPNSVTIIRGLAFDLCSSLTNIEIPSSVVSIESSTFYRCSSLESIEVDKNNEKYKSDNGVLYDKSENKLMRYPSKKENIEYEILEGTTTIGEYAFYGCNNLKNIIIPNSVTSIKKDAFCECNSITSIKIPEGVTNIGDAAFSNCSNLISIEVNENNIKYKSVNGVLYDKTENGLVQYPCKKEGKEYKILEGTKIIKYAAFRECKYLTSIKIPNSVNNISNAAFKGCSNLISIEIPNGVTSIANVVFDSCTSLTTIKIPNSVTRIVGLAFYNCSNLKNIEIPESVTKIGDSAFSGCSSLTTIKIPNGVKTIESGTFRNCSSLISIEIPESVIDIKSGSFEGCSSLINIELPSEIKKIDSYTFSECNKLSKIELPNKVTQIGKSAFYNCYSLESINIPDCITIIEDAAFYQCRRLENITMPSNLTSIGSMSFYSCIKLTNIIIPEKVIEIKDKAFMDCSKLEFIQVDENNEKYKSVDGILYDKNMEKLICYPSKKNGTYFYVPDTVKEIGCYAFMNCSKLNKIEISPNVIKIDDYAFYYGNMKDLPNIIMPEEIKEIGKDIFSYFAANGREAIIKCKPNSEIHKYIINYNRKEKERLSNYYFDSYELKCELDGIAPTLNINFNDNDLMKSIIIESDEELRKIDGWTLSEDRKCLTKTYNDNIIENITVKDLVGNGINVMIKTEEKLIIKSKKYIIDGINKYIIGIKIGETKEEIRENIIANKEYTIKTNNDKEVTNEKIGTGMKVIFETGEEYEIIVPGDLNGDGRITVTDITKIKKHIIGKETLEGCYKEAADIDRNKKLTATDLSKIKKAIVGLEEL